MHHKPPDREPEPRPPKPAGLTSAEPVNDNDSESPPDAVSPDGPVDVAAFVTAETAPRPTRPQIWVGSWLDYNNGVLHGQWIDAARDTADVWADVEAMLAASPSARAEDSVAEDWGIFDCDDFGGLSVGESENLDYVTAVARGITEHGPAFGAWAELEPSDLEHLDGFAKAYLGHYDSLHAYVEQYIDDAGWEQLLRDRLPDSIRAYVEINSAGLALDMEVSGDIFVHHQDDGTVCLFRTR